MANPLGSGFEDGLTRDEDWGAQLFKAGLEFADNPEPRCPCVLLLDTSKSMNGDRIAALNKGLQAFRDELIKDPLARQRVEIAVVTFGGTVQVIQHFVTVDNSSLRCCWLPARRRWAAASSRRSTCSTTARSSSAPSGVATIGRGSS